MKGEFAVVILPVTLKVLVIPEIFFENVAELLLWWNDAAAGSDIAALANENSSV